MGKTFCWKCQSRHDTPTGKFCTEKILDDDKFQDSREDLTLPAGGVPPPPPPPTIKPQASGSSSTVDDTIQISGAASKDDLSRRIDGLESLIYKLSENLSQDRDIDNEHSLSTASDRSPSPFRRGRRAQISPRRNQSPSKFDEFSYDALFDCEEVQVQTFSQVMVATFRTLMTLYEDG